MEKARELAALIMSNFQPNNTDTVRVNYHDLQQVTYAANAKYELVALTTVAVCFLDMSCDSSIFGLKFLNLHERWIEIGFVLASVALGINYWLRYADEGKVLTNIEQEIIDFKKRLTSSMKEISASLNVQSLVSKANKNIEGLDALLNNIKKIKPPQLEDTWEKLEQSISLFITKSKSAESWRNTPEEYDSHGGRMLEVTYNMSEAESEANSFKSDAIKHVNNFEQEVIRLKELNEDFKGLLDITQENYQDLEQALGLPEKLSSNINELTTTLEKMTLNLIKSEIKPAKAKLRIRLFMCIWPCILICLVFASFIFALCTQDYEQCEINQAILLNGVTFDH